MHYFEIKVGNNYHSTRQLFPIYLHTYNEPNDTWVIPKLTELLSSTFIGRIIPIRQKPPRNNVYNSCKMLIRDTLNRCTIADEKRFLLNSSKVRYLRLNQCELSLRVVSKYRNRLECDRF